MFSKNQLVWKVNGVILVILLSFLGLSAYVTARVFVGDVLSSARDVSGVTSQTIVQAIRGLMMARDTAGMGEFFDHLMSANSVFQSIRLVSHNGRVVGSNSEPGRPISEPGSWPCSACHIHPDHRASLEPGPLDRIFEADDGGRVVSVITPILVEEGCSFPGCHTELGASPVLGFLQADFSLTRVDDFIGQHLLRSLLALLASIVLCAGFTWWMIDRLVGRRIRTLREGAERIARKDLTFRFQDSKGDGIAKMSGTFDTMMSELSTTLSELSETKEYLQGIVESSADVIITVDPSGLIKTFNKGAEAVLGYERGEVIGKKIEMLFADPKERDVAIAGLGHTDHVVNYETHFLTKKGEVRDVILTLSRLRTPDGAPIGTFGISKDVTEEKRLQKELILKERLAAVGEAVTGMHHTLKNMLGALRGGSYMVNLGLEDDDEDLLREGWIMVQEGIGHVTGLSSEMLEYVRGWGPRLEETDLGDLMASLHRASRNLAQGKGVEVRFEVGPRPPHFNCDPRLLRSALMDLIVNAIEACEWKEYHDPEAPEVVVSSWCTKDGLRVVFQVRDNGLGIPNEIKEDIFKPFFSTKRSTGTGMGLALASRVARAHGGEIEVESEPDHGSTFRMSLPVGAPKEPKEEMHAQESLSH